MGGSRYILVGGGWEGKPNIWGRGLLEKTKGMEGITHIQRE